MWPPQSVILIGRKKTPERFGSLEILPFLWGMKKSTHTLFLEVVEENSIDLNSPNQLERVLCICKICDKLDYTEYNKVRAQRKVRVIEKYVNMMFDQQQKKFQNNWEQFFMESLEQYKDEFEPAPEVDPELPF